MATPLSNGTSTTSPLVLSQNPLLSGIQTQECSYLSSSKMSNSGLRTDNNGFCSSSQGANATTLSNQNSTPSLIKNRGDSISTSQSFQQQQSALIQNAGYSYPSFLYPNSYYTGFPSANPAPQYNYSTSAVGNGSMQNSSSSSGVNNNRRGGKKKAPIAQSQNPDVRLFFNLRRRDSQGQPNKGQSHVYKPKNPPSLSEWFKRLSVEERVNAMSTVCPNLTETFLNMYQRIDSSGQSSFAARASPNSQDQKYFSPPPYMPPYSGFGSLLATSSNESSTSSFEDCFYQRPFSETELQTIKQSEKEKFEAEQEILKNVRLTDYFTWLDTLTVSEELVSDADQFFKLMSQATNNQAFKSSCSYEMKSSNVTSIEQPNWFKPKSFHSFATWIIVALEENLWVHYNYDNNTNLGTAKANDLSTLFREKTDMGAQDVDVQQLSQFWRDTNDKDKKSLIDQFKSNAAKEAESEFNQSHSGHSKSHKHVHNKNMSYSVLVKEKPEKQSFQEQVELELKSLVDFALRPGAEQELLTSLMYTTFDRSSQRQVNVNRKFLELIKKKFKDDLMENLLQEEYQSVKSSKQFKKKKKKNFNSNNQQSSQAAQSNAGDKGAQSSTENNGQANDTQCEEQSKLKGKKKKGKQNAIDKIASNMSSLEQVQNAPLNQQRKKQKNNSNNFRNIKENQQTANKQDVSHSCDEQQTKIEIIDKEDDILESDNKNTSLDTKSSSNLFESATAHQSNESNTASNSTIKSSAGDKESQSNNENILQIQSSKSLELNPSFKQISLTDSPFKPQKVISKVESKNFQILQNSQNQDKSKNEDKKGKSKSNGYSDSLIFSEDETKTNSMKESLQIVDNNEIETNEHINRYVLELTNSMINEVCKRLESESPKMISEESSKNSQSKRMNNITQKPLHLNQGDYQEQHSNKLNSMNYKQGFNKKQRRESNQQQQKHEIEENSMRKKSFNCKKYPKDEKKFSEDFAENSSSQLLIQSNQKEVNEIKQTKDNNSRKSSYNEGNKGNQSQRKGFGIHLKNNETKNEIRAIIRQESNDNQAWAKGIAKQPDPNTNKKKGQPQKKQGNTHEQEVVHSRKNHEDDVKSLLNESAASISIKDETQSNQQNKKKRNKKKSKLTDTDIMNQFMKSLHQHAAEDHKTENHESKPGAQGHKKKNVDSRRNTLRQQPLGQDIQQSSLKSEQLNFEDSKSQTHRPYKHKFSHRNSHTNQNTVDQRQLQSKKSQEEEQQANVQQEQTQPYTQPMYQVKKNLNNKPHKPNYHKNKNSSKALEIPVDDKESVTSNKADCISDDKSSKSYNEKCLNQAESQNNHVHDQRSGAFRQLNFQEPVQVAVEVETASYSDLTGTTNTAVNTSVENNTHTQGHSKYQSYQNTPSKAVPQHPKNYNKHQNLAQNDQEAANFRTPPQPSKKQSNQLNYSHNANNRKGHHANSYQNQTLTNHFTINDAQFIAQPQVYHPHQAHSSGTNKNSQRTQGYARQQNRGQQPNNVYVQQMNLSQSVQEQRQYMQAFINPESSNIFYQDQSLPFIHQSQSADTFKAQDGIFQYVEKAAIPIHQPIPCYSPNQYQMNHFAPPQGNEMFPHPFNYPHRMNTTYFDQSQDLIFQIFNSIKSNHSMSPIPQIISPPPLLEFQISQSSELSMQPQRFDAQNHSHQEALFYQHLDNEISNFVQGIQDSILSLKPERDYVFNKLSEITGQVFAGQNPRLILFGSLITGLALESSDMDLAVTGLQIDDRFVMISELNKLSQALQDWKVLESFKSIDTASIPVIKMKVDLVKLREIEMKELENGDFAERVIPENQRYLSVDITFDDSPTSSSNLNQSFSSQDLLGPTKTHLGLQSCDLVQHYIKSYKSLKEVAILLKKFLALHKFNSPYYGISLIKQVNKIGGISSYSTVILIVAYMNYYGLRGNFEITPSRLLMGFLDFYGHYFNPGSMGISVLDDGSFFQLNSLPDSNFVILDPLNLQNNTTRNSYLTKEILEKFQCAFNNLKSLMLKLPQLQQAVLSQTAFSRANSQDQKSSIPFEKASPQPANSETPASNIQQTSVNQFQQDAKVGVEVGSEQIEQRMVPEENEARNSAIDAIKGQQLSEPLICQVCLLETFFAKDAQPVTDFSGVSISQSEPRGTLITMIEETHI